MRATGNDAIAETAIREHWCWDTVVNQIEVIFLWHGDWRSQHGGEF
ncbi:MAG: hypothetical protein IPL01_22680 [Acidobacteria bacterium]|nr:hypothetical protein [Acidobacteriota bacterium]